MSIDERVRSAIEYRRGFGDDHPLILTPAQYMAGEERCQRIWGRARKAGFVPDPEAFNLIDALLRRGINTPYDLCRGSYSLRLPGEWKCPACGKRTVAEHLQNFQRRTGMIHLPHCVGDPKTEGKP